MPKLPDFQQLGQKTIPVPANLAPVAGDQGGQYGVIADVADAVGKFALQEMDYQDKLNSARAKNNFLAWNEQFKNTLNSDQDYASYEQKYNDHMEKAKETSLSMIANNKDLQLAEVEFNQIANLEREKVKAFAWQKEVDVTRAEGLQMAKDNREMMLNTLDEDTKVELINNMQDWITGAKDRGIYDATQAEKIRQTVAIDWAQAAIEIEQPKTQLELLQSSAIADLLPGDLREKMRLRAVAAGKIQEKKTEALALQAVKQYDQQIATLVQTSPEQLDAWRAAVAGTPYQADLERLEEFEKQVQKIAEKPALEQQAFLDQKERELKFDTGASQGQVQRFNQLKTAITDNIKRMRLDPLPFIEQRRGAVFTPLDFSTIEIELPTNSQPNPDRLAANKFIINELQNRYFEMQMLQEDEKIPIKMVLLKNEEVIQIQSLLDKSTPDIQLQTFKWLKELVLTNEQYKAIMSQVAQGSSSRYTSGLLASYGADSSNTHLNAATREDIAGTARLILDGEYLLKNPKGDKDPAKFNMPTTNQLIEKLKPEIGNLYEGRLGDMKNVLPVIKSYLMGRKNADPEADVNDLIEDAVTHVIGQVIDFKKSGHNIALPIGMESRQFYDLINEQTKRYKVMPGITNDERYELIDNMQDGYLKNYSMDSYLFYHPDGTPIVFHGQYLMVGPGVQ